MAKSRGRKLAEFLRGGSDVATGSIGTDEIADGAVTAAKIAAGAAVPTQSGHAGKYLKTDGTNASWATVTDPTPASVSDESNTSTGYFDLPSGTTAQRPASPATGMIRHNTTLGLAEYYDGTQWKSIDAPPTVSSVNVTEVDSAAGGNQTVVITGSGFSSGAVATFVGYTGTDFNASTTTVNSSTQITATAPKASFLNAQEPYGVKVTNLSGLSNTLADQINVDSAPAWTTASGSLGTIYEDYAMSTITVAASDADGDSIAYSIQSGSLPTGLSLNSANGQITGTPNANGTYASGGVTHSFTVRATANSKTSDRSFSILRKWYDGSSSTQAANSAKFIKDLTGTSSDGLYWIDVPGQGPKQIWCDMNTDGGGWTLVFKYHNYNSNNFVWPTSNTYYALPTGNPRSSTYGQTNGNLPNKYSAYGATSGANATYCLFEQYDYSDGNSSYIYRGNFTSTIGNYWDSGSWHGNGSGSNEFMPSSMSQTNIVDRCSSQNGTRPTTDSFDGNRFNDKASPGSGGNWDLGGFVSGSDDVGKQGANCGRHGEAGPGSHRNASVLIWVK